MAKSSKSNGKINTDVIEVDAEEVPLEKVIDNTLVKHNVTEAVIHGLKEKYGELRLRSIDDKESYLEICDARKDVRKYGILAEKICKAGREDAIKIQKLWLSKQSEVLGKIAEVQDPLDSEINKYEREVERKELEEAQRREDAYMKRQQQLLKYGATYDNGSFVLNHISYEATLVKESDDDIWTETILPKYQREYEKNESARVAEEKKREEEAAKMKAEREALEEQQRVFREQQEAFAKQQEQLRQQQEAADKQQREAAERERIFKAQQEEKLWRSRLSELTDIGWNGQYAFDKLNDEVPVFTYEQLVSLPEKEFNAMRDGYNHAIAKRKEKEREVAEEKLRIKIEEDIRIAKEQAAHQLEQKRLREEEEARIKMEQASDKMKWDHFTTQIKEIKYPDMKNATYRGKIEEARKLLIKIINL